MQKKVLMKQRVMPPDRMSAKAKFVRMADARKAVKGAQAAGETLHLDPKDPLRKLVKK